MSTMKDVTRIIAMRNKLTAKQADAFANQFIDILKAGLNNDGIVKIKGLGTFKQVRVRERESIDVNTGKRVVIGSHDRITFTPDNTMKDSVNKPFAHFETVILNDGVSFEDTPDENETEISEEEPEEIVVPEVKKAPKPVKKAPVAPVRPKPVPVEVSEPEEYDEEKGKDEEEEEIEETELYIEKPKKHTRTIIGLVIVVIIALVIGYIVGNDDIRPFDNRREVTIMEVEEAPVETDTSNVVNDTVKAQPQDSTKAQPQDAKAQPQAAKAQPQAAKTPAQQNTTAPANDYNKDPRYRLGAYIITGTKCTHTVKAGQTLKSIAKSYLGSGMEVYVEVLNGGIKEVKEGQKINIPTLKLKKSGKRGSNP